MASARKFREHIPNVRDVLHNLKALPNVEKIHDTDKRHFFFKLFLETSIVKKKIWNRKSITLLKF